MINLLPIGQKKDLKQEKNFKLVLTFGILSISYLLSLGLLLFLIKNLLNADLEIQKSYFDQKSGRLESLKDLQDKIVESNKNFSDLKNFYSGRTDYANAFDKINSILPDGISISSVSFPSEENGSVNVSLNGFSGTREDLSVLKKNLEADGKNFSDISFPPESWIKKTDIDFAISFKILPDKITASAEQK